MANWEKLIEEHYSKKNKIDENTIFELIEQALLAEGYQDSEIIKNHPSMRLSTKGTKKAGGEPYDEDPPKARSKSAPAGFGALEEELLEEGDKGVAHSDKMGSVITDKSGNKLTLSQFEFIKVGDKVGDVAIEDTETLAAVTDELTKNSEVLYKYPEKITKASKAVIIVFAKDEKEDLKSFIKYTKSSPFWQEKDFSLKTGWTLSGTQSSKEILAFGPSTLIGSGEVIPIANLPKTVINNAQGKLPQAFVTSLGPFFEAVYNKGNSPLSFDNPEQRDKSMSSLDKYFGEIMAPVLLGKEHMLSPQPNDALKRAAKTFGVNWNEASGVSYPEEANFPLVDSFLHFGYIGSTKIGVSSKSKKGANPSVKNFTDLINPGNEQRRQEINKTLRNDGFGNFLDLLGIISEETSIVGPFVAAEYLGILDSKERDRWEKIINGESTKLTDKLNKLSAYHTGKTIREYPAWQPTGKKKKNPNYTATNHLIAGVAKAVENKVNKGGVGGKTFTEFAKAAYALADMVQIYGKFSPEGDQSAKMENFRIIYPPLFDGEMFLDAGKNYYSSGQKGKLTIKIK